MINMVGYRGGRSGGSLHDLRGTTITFYAWGLRNVSNNLAEAYALCCGLFRTLLVFGDSMIFIKALIGKSYHKGSKLKNIILTIKQEVSLFVKVSLFHIKRYLNEEAYKWAN
jgi:hypothetical protein